MDHHAARGNKDPWGDIKHALEMQRIEGQTPKDDEFRADIELRLAHIEKKLDKLLAAVNNSGIS